MSLQAMLSTLLNIGKRFYCHQCEADFRSRPHVTDPKCPQCGSEFVEALETDEEGQTARAGDNSSETPPSRGAEGGGGAKSKEKDETSMEVDDADDPEPEVIDRDPPSDYHDPFANIGPRGPDRPDWRFPPGEPLITIRIPRPRPLAVQIHEHIENLMTQHREREAARERGEQQTDGGEESSQSTQQTGQESRQTSQETSQADQPTSQASSTSQETSQADQPTSQASSTSQETSQTSEESRSDPRRFIPRSERTWDDPLADMHLSVGMPWYFMLHHRDHARREQPPPARGPQLGAPVFLGFGGSDGGRLHGSPADYVWGPQGVDNIISQMLASLEDPGPPPAEKEKIESLPTVEATEDSLKDCTQCSVCKDSFSTGESLLQMPCLHLYHKDCIIPWLKLHDTCPTCRFHLNSGEPDEHKGPV